MGRDVRIFRGIPYAAPPVGDLRWRPPAPPAAWKGLRDATRFGPVCPQLPRTGLYRAASGPQSEDCLTLNVWAPAASPRQPLPVLFWIHGGGHVMGAGSMPHYDGRVLAGHGAIVVTINYRLGPFGFLVHPLLAAEAKKERGRAVSGNLGLLDTIAALRWVKQNVASFGGDPARVTIFGESAGAASVGCLMVSPLTEGLFQRAIAESGGVGGIAGRDALAQGRRLVEALGVSQAKDPLAALRAVPAEKILAAAHPVAAAIQRKDRWGPVVDGWVLPDDPAKLWAAGRQHDVPFLVGTTADDGGIFADQVPVKRPLGYRLLVKKIYGADADAVLALFPPARGAKLKQTMRDLLTASVFESAARAMARAMEKVPSKAWRYRFSRVSPVAASLGVGAAHGFEIPYVFGTGTPVFLAREEDRHVADAMQRMWVHFAATGDPNVEGLPAWPAYESRTDPLLDFGTTIEVRRGLHREALDLFDRIRAGRAR